MSCLFLICCHCCISLRKILQMHVHTRALYSIWGVERHRETKIGKWESRDGVTKGERKEYRNEQRGRETEWERQREWEILLNHSERLWEHPCVCVCLCVYVCFHPDPVGSTGAKHVTSTQAHTDSLTVPHRIEWLGLTVFLEKKHIQRKLHSPLNRHKCFFLNNKKIKTPRFPVGYSVDLHIISSSFSLSKRLILLSPNHNPRLSSPPWL